jgi:hypothetical protein
MFSFLAARKRALRLFRAAEMTWTMFSPASRSHALLAAHGIGFTDDVRDADIVIAERIDALLPHGASGRGFAVWTPEPRYSTAQRSPVTSPGIRRPVHVMNCYTGLNRHPLAQVGRAPLDRDAAIRAFRGKPRRTAMLASHFVERDLYLGRRNIDLNAFRIALARHFQAQGDCDVYGLYWPDTVVVSGESRGKGWVAAKQEILRGYDVNIAIENTSVRYYVSEKLWQAIRGACLPVYYGHDNGIYEVFPRDSFVEAHGRTPAELYDIVQGMRPAERLERFVRCVDALNRGVARSRDEQLKAALVARTAAFLRRI